MNRAQGNTRSLPDGFLHIQNFTVTKAAGMAAVVYTHLLGEEQRGQVELLLVDRARYQGAYDGETYVHHKHGVFRFRKDFLKENFQKVVHATTKITRQPIIEDFKAKLIAERNSLDY